MTDTRYRSTAPERWPADAPGALPDSVPRTQSVTSDWEVVQPLIDGVVLLAVRPVVTGNGYLTEVFRQDWFPSDVHVDQVFARVLETGCISAWHVHATTTDRLFIAAGRARIVLYDARDTSPTHGLVSEHLLGDVRPSLVIVPPGVWHGVQAVADGGCTLLNLVDAAYDYEAPDHWALPHDTPHIPYSFATA